MVQADSAPKDPSIAHGAWALLFLVSFSYFNLYLDRSLVNYFHRPMAEEFGLLLDGLDKDGKPKLDDEKLGLLLGFFFTPYAVAQLAAGWLGDRFRRRTIILASLTGSALILAASAFARNYAEFLAWRVLMGIVQAPAVPAFSSAIADVFSAKARSSAVALYLAAYNMALVVAGKFGGRLADQESWSVELGPWHMALSGWRMSLVVFSLVALVAAALFALAFREPERRERLASSLHGDKQLSLAATLQEALRRRAFLAIGTQFWLTTLSINVVASWFARYLTDRFTLTQEDAGFWSTVALQPATITGLLLGGVVADQLARWYLAGRTSVQMVGMCLAALGIVGMGLSHELRLVVGATIVYGLGVGLYQANLWAATFEVVDPAARATAIGLLNVVAGVGGSWISWAVGRYHPALGGPGKVMALMSACFIGALLVMLVSARFFLPRDHVDAQGREAN